MNRKLFLVFAMVLALAVFGAALSANTTQQAETQTTTEHHHHNDGMMMDSQTMLNHLDQQLSLTADQKTKIKTILENANQQAQALRENGPKGKDAMRELHQNMHAQIRAALTPEQQQKFDSMMKQHEGMRHRDNDASSGSSSTENPK